MTETYSAEAERRVREDLAAAISWRRCSIRTTAFTRISLCAYRGRMSTS